MLLIPQDLTLLGYCLLIPAVFEIVRIALGYLIAGPSSKINELEKEKILVQIELRAIKSVQLELVKNSKLERKVIKIDKEIETLNAQQEPKVEKTRKVLRILRTVFYAAMCFVLSYGPVVLISPQVVWPFSWLSSERTMALPTWFLLLAIGAACRHLLRTLLPFIFPTTSFP